LATNIILALLTLSLLVFVHEVGHFLMAVATGARVEIFSIGFGRALWKRKFFGTEYRLSLIPLGGYVAILNDGSEMSLNRKPVWKRALVAFAGPLANFVLAVIIFSTLFSIGGQIPTNIVQAVTSGSPAERGGLIAGDKIVGTSGKKIESQNELAALLADSPGAPLRLDIEKDGGKVFSTTVIPDAVKIVDQTGEEKIVGRIGITFRMSGEKMGLFESLYYGTEKTLNNCRLIIHMLFKMFSNQVSSESIAGPIFILMAAGDQADAGLVPLFAFAAMLSLNLAVFNLLPIPVLDGGELLLLFIESIKGSPVNESAMEMFHRTGLAMMALLFLYAFYSDITRLLS